MDERATLPHGAWLGPREGVAGEGGAVEEAGAAGNAGGGTGGSGRREGGGEEIWVACSRTGRALARLRPPRAVAEALGPGVRGDDRGGWGAGGGACEPESRVVTALGFGSAYDPAGEERGRVLAGFADGAVGVWSADAVA